MSGSHLTEVVQILCLYKTNMAVTKHASLVWGCAVLLLSFLATTKTVVVKASPTTTATTTPPLPGCPQGCTCTQDRLTIDCSNRGLVRLPHMSTGVVKLDVSRNLLGPMINGSMEHLRQLQEVDLSHNGFLRLQLCTFTGLLHLRRVRLHGNRLSSLPASLFADNGLLEELDLSDNLLDELPDMLLHSLPQLKVLDLSHNNIAVLRLGTRFQIVTQLTLLDLSHNPLVNVTQDAFSTATSWDHALPRVLDLSFCQLHHVHPQALTQVPALRTLRLAGNPELSFEQVVSVLQPLEASGLEVVSLSNMSISDPGLFSSVTLMALRELDLSSNAISSVPADTFGNIRSLRKLDLSGNALAGLDEGFGDLVNLLELNVSHCRLSSFQGSAVSGLSQLTSLDLSHNQLLDPGQVDLSPLTHLQLLDLGHNSLQGVVLPGDCAQLVTLTFTSNALTSLPSMANMRSLKYFSASDNNIQSLSEFLFTEASDILVANFSHNDLTTIDHRAFLPTSPRVIDLSHNLLTRTKFFSWTSTREVHLHHNRLREVDQHTFYGMSQLRVVDLSHNNLTMLDEDTFRFLANATSLLLSNNALTMSSFFTLFRNMRSLQHLDMGFNHIKVINASSFEPLTSLQTLSLTSNKLRVIPAQLFSPLEDTLTLLDISGNPFHCHCELLPLQDWLSKTQVTVRQWFDRNVTNRCLSPPGQRGKLVGLYQVGDFQCNSKLLYTVIFGSLGGLAILVGIVASLVCHYYSRWRGRGGRRKRGRGSSDQVPLPEDSGQPGAKEDNTSRGGKDINRNKVDLVRVSKRPDPYNKEDLINGWVASKQFTVPKQNLDPQHYRGGSPHHQHHPQQGPPSRPPWPEKVTSSSPPKRNTKEEKNSRKGKDKATTKGEEKAKKKGGSGEDKVNKTRTKAHNSKQDNNRDRRIRTVSETVPLRESPPQRRDRDRDRTQTMWEEAAYYGDNRLPLRPRGDPYYPTWHPRERAGGRSAHYRHSSRYYTLPYPHAAYPRYNPYGSDYPYRVRVSAEEEEEEEAGYHSRQQQQQQQLTRPLPYPPRQPDLRVHAPHVPRPPPDQYRNNQRSSSSGRPYDPYGPDRARDLFTERPRDPYTAQRTRDPYVAERTRDPYAANERARVYENLPDGRDGERWRQAVVDEREYQERERQERERQERERQERDYQEREHDYQERDREYQERAFQENYAEIRRERQEFEGNRQPDPRPVAAAAATTTITTTNNNNGRHAEGRGANAVQDGNGGNNTPQGQGDQATAVKRGTSQAQVHRRDSDYRNAMDSPVDPKANKPPSNVNEETTSEWL